MEKNKNAVKHLLKILLSKFSSLLTCHQFPMHLPFHVMLWSRWLVPLRSKELILFDFNENNHDWCHDVMNLYEHRTCSHDIIWKLCENCSKLHWHLQSSPTVQTSHDAVLLYKHCVVSLYYHTSIHAKIFTALHHMFRINLQPLEYDINQRSNKALFSQ